MRTRCLPWLTVIFPTPSNSYNMSGKLVVNENGGTGGRRQYLSSPVASEAGVRESLTRDKQILWTYFGSKPLLRHSLVHHACRATISCLPGQQHSFFVH